MIWSLLYWCMAHGARRWGDIFLGLGCISWEHLHVESAITAAGYVLYIHMKENWYPYSNLYLCLPGLQSILDVE
jgi:hypothetical protein